jgi:hypothetical protein
MQSITITADRLITHTIPITADSTAELATHAGGYNDYAALLVDGAYYDLVMCKHISGRPEITAALNQALADVRAAIAALNTPPDEPSDLPIPLLSDILALVKERYDTARLHDDYPGAGRLDRVRANLGNGAVLSWSYGDLLIQSVNNPGSVYSVSRSGCTCPNGAAGKASCWHVCLFDLLLDMQQVAADSADIEAERDAEEEPPTPITVRTAPGGLSLTRNGITIVTDPSDLVRAMTRLAGEPAPTMGQRIAAARATYLAA